MKLTEDQIRDLKYALVEALVMEGIVPDCTDTDDNAEIDAENAIENVLTDIDL